MKYVMVIDDSPTIRVSVEYALKNLGHPIRQAENGTDAIQKIGAYSASGDSVMLCICDVNMPVMDGITFIREFRKTDSFTPILVLTTESENEKIKEGREAGASGWVIKPFEPAELGRVVEKLIR